MTHEFSQQSLISQGLGKLIFDLGGLRKSGLRQKMVDVKEQMSQSSNT